MNATARLTCCAPTADETPIVLTHGQAIRLATWKRPDYAKVGTVAGMTLETQYYYEGGVGTNLRLLSDNVRAELQGRMVKAAVDLATSRKHDLVFATYAGSCITTCKGYYEQEDAIYADAVSLIEGQLVSIDDRLFRIWAHEGNVRAPRLCDPLYFVPV